MPMPMKDWYRVVYGTTHGDFFDTLEGEYVNVNTAINSIPEGFKATKAFRKVGNEWVKVWSL